MPSASRTISEWFARANSRFASILVRIEVSGMSTECSKTHPVLTILNLFDLVKSNTMLGCLPQLCLQSRTRRGLAQSKMLMPLKSALSGVGS